MNGVSGNSYNKETTVPTDTPSAYLAGSCTDAGGGADCCEAPPSPLTEGVEAAVFGPLVGVGGVFATNPRS